MEKSINFQRIFKHIYWNLKENRWNSVLRLLNSSEDMALRLSTAAASSNISYRCDIIYTNITLGSSFWDGETKQLFDCDLNHTKRSVLERFPLKGPSAILLPQSSIAANASHTSGGFIINSHFLDHLLPGRNKLVDFI